MGKAMVPTAYRAVNMQITPLSVPFHKYGLHREG
jgi:hypothetical protein